MALTLRELLDKQRAEREARERGPEQVSIPQQPELKKALDTIMQPGFGQTVQVPPPTAGRGLLSRLSGGQGNANQSTAQASQTAAAGTETKPQSGNGLAALPDAEKSIPSTVASVPTFSDDETAILRKNLAFLAANLDEKEVIPQVLRTTVRQIQEHPELNAVLVDNDFDLIIAAAKRSMKYAQRKKEDKADGRSRKKNEAEELKGFLKDAGIDLDF